MVGVGQSDKQPGPLCVVPNERSDVKFPLWRKKMDGAMFDDKCTVLPIWVRDRLFNITERFPHRSKTNPASETKIIITHKGGRKTSHIAHVTTLPRPKLGPTMRLQFGNDVKEWLSVAFQKTHHRNEERKALGLNGPTIERLMPFWEFIDIEWDAEEGAFHFRAWYTQGDTGEPQSPEASHDEADHDDEPQPPRYTAWMVLQKPDSIYADVESECYEYPRSIPNGARIGVGDYLICTLSTKSSKAGKRIIGIGRIARISEYDVDGKTMRKAFYDWYRAFVEPKTFDFIGGDPRNNIYNSMNSIPAERVNHVVDVLVGEFSEDDHVMAKEAEFLTNLSSDTSPSNQFPEWLTKALNNADD